LPWFIARSIPTRAWSRGPRSRNSYDKAAASAASFILQRFLANPNIDIAAVPHCHLVVWNVHHRQPNEADEDEAVYEAESDSPVSVRNFVAII
jgi:hypothetical protein